MTTTDQPEMMVEPDQRPTPNVDLLRAVMQLNRDNPKVWNQKAYAVQTECGTAFCFAGLAVVVTPPRSGTAAGG